MKTQFEYLFIRPKMYYLNYQQLSKSLAKSCNLLSSGMIKNCIYVTECIHNTTEFGCIINYFIENGSGNITFVNKSYQNC